MTGRWQNTRRTRNQARPLNRDQRVESLDFREWAVCFFDSAGGFDDGDRVTKSQLV